jgi:hypothetical protein
MLIFSSGFFLLTLHGVFLAYPRSQLDTAYHLTLYPHLYTAVRDEEGITVFRKKPKNTIVREAKEKGLWQEEWTNTTKGAVTKSFFPSVQQRLRLVIPATAEFTSMVTGHGNTRAYLYRFRIIEDETCTCKKGPQTVSHLLFECDNLTTARSHLKKRITTKGDNWPVSYDKLTNNYLKQFVHFFKSTNFELL